MLARLWILTCGLAAVLTASAATTPFTVVVYNVENLFDADGVAVYDDYQPGAYRPAHVVTKVRNIARVLAKFQDGQGPDLALLQEVEIDQTPGTRLEVPATWLTDRPGERLDALAAAEALPPEWAGAPAEAWLLLALAEAGLQGYTVVTGDDAPSPPGTEGARAIKCVTLTRFPVRAVRQYPMESARNLLEVEVEVHGAPLYVFNQHWKSGAGDPETETLRLQNAAVLRERLDEILAMDAQADIVIGGDLNSHYNQRRRYPAMNRTGINDTLRAGGDETALATGQADLFNLWFELPPAQRGSDTYRGEWGTLMHLIVSRGLYDGAGVGYLDNSFGVARLPGINADAAGAPRRWDAGGATGSGFSDHLPLFARFRRLPADDRTQWQALSGPADGAVSGEVWRVDYSRVDLSGALRHEELPAGADLTDGTWTGRLFSVKGEALPGRNLRVRWAGRVFDVYAPERSVRDLLQTKAVGGVLEFVGELGSYRGNWQMVVRDATWVR